MSILSKRFGLYLLIFLFSFYSAWIVILHTSLVQPGDILFDVFTDSYGIIAAVGAVIGLKVTSMWGGFRSIVGRAILMFSIGLLLQFLGQLTFTYYRIFLGDAIPYPSLAEVFYFGSIPVYIYAAWQMAVVAGVKYNLKNPKYQFIIWSIVIAMIGFAYYSFLTQYSGVQIDEKIDYVILFLELGYPVGQAIYVSLAIITLILSKNILGGIMRSKVLIVLSALIAQYIADIYFTYEYLNGILYAGGLSDYLYMITYFIMAIAIYLFCEVSVGQSPPKNDT